MQYRAKAALSNHEEERQVLLGLLQEACIPALEQTVKECNGFNWDWLLTTAAVQEIFFLVGHRLLSQPVWKKYLPARQMEELAGSIMTAEAKEKAVSKEMRTIVLNLEKAGVRAVIIKGPIAATYYPRNFLRPMSDLDLLIAEDELPKAQEGLRNLGYVPLSFDSASGIAEKPVYISKKTIDAFGNHWHAHYKIDEQSQMPLAGAILPYVDVHSPRHRGYGSHVLLDVSEWITQARKIQVFETEAYSLNPEDAIMQICCNLRVDHFGCGATGLLKMMDLYLLIKAGVNWNAFREKFRRFAAAQEAVVEWFNWVQRLQGYTASEGPWFDGCDIVSNVHYGLKCLNEFFAETVPNDILEMTRPQDERMTDLLYVAPHCYFLWNVPIKKRILSYPYATPNQLIEKGVIKYWRKAPPFSFCYQNSHNRYIWSNAPRIRP
jgi:hypothetical protein